MVRRGPRVDFAAAAVCVCTCLALVVAGQAVSGLKLIGYVKVLVHGALDLHSSSNRTGEKHNNQVTTPANKTHPMLHLRIPGTIPEGTRRYPDPPRGGF